MSDTNTAVALSPSAVLSMAPGANLGAYVQTVSAIPILSIERERELAERLFYENCVDSARELVLAHLRFVVHVARSYSGYGLQEADLIQEGNVGLMKAVKRFDPTKGVRLVSFAVHWIKAEMHEYILKNWRIVKVATTKAQRKLFFNLRSQKTGTHWLTEAETLAIAEDLGVDPAEVTRMESRLSGRDVAFDMPVDADEESAWQAPQQYLEDQSMDPAMVVESADYVAHEENQLSEALSSLDARSRDIVARRWLSEPKATLHELADEYGVSAERIRQLESNAMKKAPNGNARLTTRL